MAPETTARMALAGVRILDFTWVVAGPVATRILADQGAEVIKIERGDEGTMSVLGPRRIGLQGELHRNKRSAAINMTKPRGVELARRLAAMSDLVMDNFSARVMRMWGMDYASLAKIKPDIISISMSGLGHTGPRSNYVSYGPTLQALAGFTHMMADARGEPVGYGYSYADMAGGYSGALAALIALWHRKRTGHGQFVDLSQFEALASLAGPALLDIAVNGRAQEAPGWRSQEAPAAPHGDIPMPPARRRRRPLDRDRGALAGRMGTLRRALSAIRNGLRSRNFARSTSGCAIMRNSTRRSRDGPRLRTPRPRWHCCKARTSPPVSRSTAPTSHPIRIWPSAASSRRSNFPMTVPPASRACRCACRRRPGSIRTVAPEVGEDNDYILGELLGLGRAERAELIAEGVVWG